MVNYSDYTVKCLWQYFSQQDVDYGSGYELELYVEYHDLPETITKII